MRHERARVRAERLHEPLCVRPATFATCSLVSASSGINPCVRFSQRPVRHRTDIVSRAPDPMSAAARTLASEARPHRAGVTSALNLAESRRRRGTGAMFPRARGAVSRCRPAGVAALKPRYAARRARSCDGAPIAPRLARQSLAGAPPPRDFRARPWPRPLISLFVGARGCLPVHPCRRSERCDES